MSWPDIIIVLLIIGLIVSITHDIYKRIKYKSSISIKAKRNELEAITRRDHINPRSESVYNIAEEDVERIKDGNVAFWIANDINDLYSSTKDLKKGNILDVKAMMRETNDHINESFEDVDSCLRSEKEVKFASVTKSIFDELMKLLFIHQHLDVTLSDLKNITIPDFISLFSNSDIDNNFPNNEWLVQLYTYSSYIRIKWESIDSNIRSLIMNDPKNTTLIRYIRLATVIDNLFLSRIFDVDVINKDVEKRRGDYIVELDYPPCHPAEFL